MTVIKKEVVAPVSREQIFAVLSDALRVMQLRSDWGSLQIEQISPDFPVAGSGYMLRPKSDTASFGVTVEEVLPDQRLVLSCSGGVITRLVWTLKPHDDGCLLQLDETLAAEDETTLRVEEEQAREWLDNIKNYTALGHSGWQGALRWILERHVLRLRAEQRRVILMLVVLQVVTLLTFVAALLGLGLVSLIASWFRA